jgi:hypothetical protein
VEIRRQWNTGVFILALSLLLIACNVGNNGEAGGDMAKVDRVEIVASAGNPPGYAAVASGLLPDQCTQLGRASQRVVATTIRVTLPTQPAAGACSQVGSAPFEETIPLKLTGLSAGSYAVEVNGVTASLYLEEDQ